MVLIGGFQKSSLIDYPEKISAIVFTQGCNFRCPYCHNPELVEMCNLGKLKISLPEVKMQRSKKVKLAKPSEIISNSQLLNSSTAKSVLEFLKMRINKLDGVVITGGEPTLQKGLKEFIKEIKSLGFSVKLDTNGTNPNLLNELINEELIDYVAMDIKAPVEKYSAVVCVEVKTANILKSIELIKNSELDYEFRTTVLPSQLEVDDFESIGKMIDGAKKYYLQKFVPAKTLDESYMTESNYSDEEFLDIKKGLKKYVNHVQIR